MTREIKELRCLVWADQKLKKKKSKTQGDTDGHISNLRNGKPPTQFSFGEWWRKPIRLADVNGKL